MKPQKTPREPEQYHGWTIRYVIPPKTATNSRPFWQADNNDRSNRQRKSFKTKADALNHVDGVRAELEKHGTANSLDDGARDAALRALREIGDRATLDDIVRFWKERHPTDGNRITLADMAEKYLAHRLETGNRPETIKEIRRKLAAFTKAQGDGATIASVKNEEVVRFVNGAGGGAASRRAWRKVLGSFFKWCEAQGAMKGNPAQAVVVPSTIRKTPAYWAARDVESFMRICEQVAPDYSAAFAVLWFAGLRPTELAGQYGLEHEKITDAKKTLAQALTNYEAEKMRMGLVRGRGADTAKQAKNRERLDGSAQAQALADAREHLARMQKKHGGEAMQGLQWADMCLDDEERFISVRAETSKVLEPRHVEISPNLEAWLRKYRKIGGPLVANPTAFRRARERILKRMPSVKWTADVCRHSFASYHYKAHGDRDRLAAAMGHSANSRQIELHYKNPLVMKSDAESFWSIVPDGAALDGPQAEKRTAREGTLC
jgi:integrase